MQFPLGESTHSIHRMPIHLQYEQLINFQLGEEERALANFRDTELMAWFKFNQTNTKARHLLYHEVSAFIRGSCLI